MCTTEKRKQILQNEHFITYEYATSFRLSGCWFASLAAQSWQYRDRRKSEVETMPYSFRMTPRVLHSAQYLDSTAHDGPLNSIKQQPGQMSHRSRPPSFKGWYLFKIRLVYTGTSLHSHCVLYFFVRSMRIWFIPTTRGGGGVPYNYSDSRERSDSEMSRVETCSNLITPASRLLSVFDLLPRVVVEIGSTIIEEENQPFNLSRSPKAVFYIYTNILHLKIILNRNIPMNMFHK